MKRMDVSIYPQGAIYYYHNSFTTKEDYDKPDINHDFLTDRPVIVISDNMDNIFTMERVVCILCTTSPKRLGIVFDMYNTINKAVIKNTALPYEVRTISTEYLRDFQGVLAKDVLSKVIDAYKYHMGFSDTIPTYSRCPDKAVNHYEVHLVSNHADDIDNDGIDEPDTSMSKQVNHITHHQKAEPVVLSLPNKNTNERSTDPESEQDKEEDENVESLIHNITLQYPTSLTNGRLQQLRKEIMFQKSTKFLYETLSMSDKFNIVKQNSIKCVLGNDKLSPYIASRFVKAANIDVTFAIKEFLKFVGEDKHRMQFLSEDQKIILQHVTNAEIYAASPKNKYSDNYLNNTRARYAKKTA